MESTPSVVPEVTQGKPRTLLLIGVLIVIIGILASAIWILQTPGGVRAAISATTLPEELRDATVIANQRQPQSNAYVPRAFWYEEVALGDGRITALTQGNTSTVVVRMTPAGEYQLYEDDVVRVRSQAAIHVPAVAPNGKIIAYARMAEETHAETAVASPAIPPHIMPVNPADTDIEILQTLRSEGVRVVSGYAPLFIDDARFIFFTPAGVYRYDLGSGAIAKLLTRPFPYMIGAVMQSPDRSLIAFSDPVTATTVVYRVGEQELAQVTELPGLMFSMALSDHALYEVKGTQAGADIWRYLFDGSTPVKIHTFPVELAVGRLTF